MQKNFLGAILSFSQVYLVSTVKMISKGLVFFKSSPQKFSENVWSRPNFSKEEIDPPYRQASALWRLADKNGD